MCVRVCVRADVFAHVFVFCEREPIQMGVRVHAGVARVQRSVIEPGVSRRSIQMGVPKYSSRRGAR